jgi:hypothetical protein
VLRLAKRLFAPARFDLFEASHAMGLFDLGSENAEDP